MLPEAASGLEVHLTACNACCRLLADIPCDSFIDRLRDADSADHHAKDQSNGLARPLVVDGADVPPELVNHPRYRILGLVGQGGMGAVYRAEHRTMDRPVALKVIRPGLMRHQASVQRFKQEVRAAARLVHPNIVHAYDADQAGGLHFLVMEYIDGISLAELVRRRGPLPVVEACEYIRQAALGLQHAHVQGMVHRDIKPQNLMLQSVGGAVKILDFGLVRLPHTADNTADGSFTTGSLTSVGAVMGTADYIAPEQADDAGSADIRADIYSLGCTMFYLLTGQPPFSKSSAAEKIAAHADKPLPPLERSDVPVGLTAVLERMTAKEPAHRFGTPAEVATAIGPFCQSAAARSVRRSYLIAAAMLLLIAGLTAFVIWRSGFDSSGARQPNADSKPDVRDGTLGNTNTPVPDSRPKEKELMIRNATKVALFSISLSLASCQVKVSPTNNADVPGGNNTIGGDSVPGVQVVQKLGGNPIRDDKAPGKPLVEAYIHGEKVTDAALKELAVCTNLRKLSLNGSRITDDGLKELAALKNLEWLELTSTQFSGVGLKDLSGMSKLTTLDLNFSKVNDAGMTSVGKLTQLRTLNLISAPITDEGLKEAAKLANLEEIKAGQVRSLGDVGVKALAACKKLKRLEITNCDLSDHGMKALAGLDQLEHLYVYGTRVTDEGVKAIANLPNLQELWLSFDVGDEGVKALKGHPKLRELKLNGLNNTDACLNDLAQIKSLRKLEFRKDCRVTDAGLDKLRAALPNCNVLR